MLQKLHNYAVCKLNCLNSYIFIWIDKMYSWEIKKYYSNKNLSNNDKIKIWSISEYRRMETTEDTDLWAGESSIILLKMGFYSNTRNVSK